MTESDAELLTALSSPCNQQQKQINAQIYPGYLCNRNLPVAHIP